MKKSAIFLALVSTAMLASAASASNEGIARQLVDITHRGDRRVAPSAKPGFDPVKREAHFRRLAAGFYAKKLSESELNDLVGFYQSAPGVRFLKTEDKLEKEILIVAFSAMLAPAKAEPAPVEVDAKSDPRLPIAEKLLATPRFKERIDQHAANYDKMKAGAPGSEAATVQNSRDRIRELYVERYAKRFSRRVLTELAAFHDSKLGRKYVDLEKQLAAHLQKQAGSFK